MTISLVFYIITVLTSIDNIVSLLVYAIGAYLIVLCVYALFETDTFIGKVGKNKKHHKVLLSIAIPIILIDALIPSKNDMYIMVGLYVGEKMVTSESGNQIINKSYEAIISKLDNVIEESAKEKLDKELSN